MKQFLTFILILFILDSFAQCPCSQIETDVAIKMYDQIIAVQLFAKTMNIKRFDKNQSFPKGIVNTFIVIGEVKGDFIQGDTISCLTGNGINDDGYKFEIGEKYLLFYEKYIDKCSPTKKLKSQEYYELNRKLSSKTESRISSPLPPPGYKSTLFKYELLGSYYVTGLQAKIVSSNQESIVKDYNLFLNRLEKIEKPSMISIILKSNNEIKKIRIIKIGGKEFFDPKIKRKIKDYIEEKIRFITIGQECLINNSFWSYLFKKY